MKKVLALAILYQLYLVTRSIGAGAESLLAARAIMQGQVPYRDFMIHVGPLPAYLFAGLYSIPAEAWPSLVFIASNLIAAWGLYKLARLHFNQEASLATCALFLVVIAFYGGNEMYQEVMVIPFGVWGMYFFERKYWACAGGMFLMGLATKQTAVIFPIAALIGLWL